MVSQARAQGVGAGYTPDGPLSEVAGRKAYRPCQTAPNKALQPTAYSLRSSVAPAFSSG